MKALLGFAVLACSVIPASGDPLNFSFQSIVNPNDPTFTQLLGINDASNIAGYFGSGAAGHPNQGFTLTLPHTFTPENFPGSVQTQVVGINNTGETVGFWIDAAGVNHAFTKIGNTFKNVDNPNTTTVTQFLGVNDAGSTAGYWTDAMGNFHAFTWVPGTFTDVIPPGAVSVQATDVNNGGSVVGFNMTSATTSDGFLDVGGMFTALDFPGSVFTQALGLNNAGEVVGSYVDAMGVTNGFVYNIASKSFQSVDDPLGVGPTKTVINGVNDKGQIVGFYTDANGNTIGFVGGAVPEPSSLILLGTALAALGLKLRRPRA